MSSSPTNKPLTWEHLDAPPVWGHGAKGDTVHMPEFDVNGVMVSKIPAPEASAAAARNSAAPIAPLVKAVAATSTGGGSFTEHDLGSSGIEIKLKPIAVKKKEETVASETVFGGPAPVGSAETVFDGPAAGTVFDESNFQTKRPDISVAQGAVKAQIQRRAMWFVVTALLNFMEYAHFSGSSPIMAGLAAITGVVFLVMAVLAFRMNRVAFLVGLGFYAIGIAALLAVLFLTELPLLFVAKPLVARCFLFYRHYRNYGLLTDLKLLEESV